MSRDRHGRAFSNLQRLLLIGRQDLDAGAKRERDVP
jgi:hypothetical protein